MARSPGRDRLRSVLKAAARLDEINREVAEILRVFPSLRVLSEGLPRLRPRRALRGASRSPAAFSRQVH